MADLGNKVISTNYQKLLQISSSTDVTGVVLDGTGSAYALRLSGSSNVAIGGEPKDNINLFVAGNISASTLQLDAETLYIGSVTASQNSNGGITFTDSASHEMGAFQGDGYFTLSSSIATGGSARPLFNMSQQVGSTQNVNIAQIKLSTINFFLESGNAQWMYGSQPSGSDYVGDFFLNDNFTAQPRPDSSIISLRQPAFYVTASNKYWGIGTFPNSTNMMRISGSLFVEGPVGHITASGNISASGYAHKFGGTSEFANMSAQYLLASNGVLNNIDIGTSSPAGTINVGQLTIANNSISPADGYDLVLSPVSNKRVIADSSVILGSSNNSSNINLRGSITASGNISQSAASSTLSAGTGYMHELTISGTLQVRNSGISILSHISASNITASGNISSSGVGYFGGITASGNLEVSSISSSGNISASGDVFADNITAGSHLNIVYGDIKLPGSGIGRGAIRWQSGSAYDVSLQSSGGEFSIYSGSALYHTLLNAGDGNVGIHNFNPTEALTVEGNISASGVISTNSNITASGNISGSGTSTGSFGHMIIGYHGDIEMQEDSHIFFEEDRGTYIASTNPSELKIVAGNSATMMISHSRVGIRTTTPQAALGVHGDISSSGDVYADELRLSGGKIYEDGTKRLELGPTNYITGHLSASGDISSSGVLKIGKWNNDVHTVAGKITASYNRNLNIAMTGMTASKAMFTGLPQSGSQTMLTGELYYATGAQLGLSGSHPLSQSRIEASKFVLIA